MPSGEERHDAMKRLIFRALLPLITGATLLGGCTASYVAEKIQVDAWTEASMLRDGWLEVRNIRPQPIYCYRTLAAPECYRKIQPHEQNRLVGYFDDTDR